MYQWYSLTMKAEYIYSLSWFWPWPHLPTLAKPFSFPQFWQSLASLELSLSILTYEPHEAGWTSVRPLKYCSFTNAVSSSGHVERTSNLFTAVESQLGERQVCSQLIQVGFCEKHLITGYSTAWSLDWQLRGWNSTNHNVGNEEPSSWNGKLFFNKEKQPF